MKTATLLLSSLIFVTSFFATSIAHAQGSGSTGGGDIVMTLDGKAMLVDLVDLKNPFFMVTRDEISARYFRNDPWSSYVVRSAPDEIFDCAQAFLKKAGHTYPILTAIAQLSKNMDVGMTEAYFEADKLLMLDSVRASTLSSTVDENYQVPVAIFEYQTLIINERLYKRMDAINQCALMTHELLRLLNFYLDQSDTLSTADIEETVRMFFKQEKLSSSLEARLKKMHLGKEFSAEYEKFLNETASQAARLNHQQREFSVTLNNAPDLVDQFSREFGELEASIHERIAVLRAKQMKMKQLKNPTIKQTAIELKYGADDVFGNAIISNLWRGRDLFIPGQLNVITHEVKNQWP